MIQNMTNWKDQHEALPNEACDSLPQSSSFLFLKLISLVRG